MANYTNNNKYSPVSGDCRTGFMGRKMRLLSQFFYLLAKLTLPRPKFKPNDYVIFQNELHKISAIYEHSVPSTIYIVYPAIMYGRSIFFPDHVREENLKKISKGKQKFYKQMLD